MKNNNNAWIIYVIALVAIAALILAAVALSRANMTGQGIFDFLKKQENVGTVDGNYGLLGNTFITNGGDIEMLKGYEVKYDENGEKIYEFFGSTYGEEGQPGVFRSKDGTIVGLYINEEIVYFGSFKEDNELGKTFIESDDLPMKLEYNGKTFFKPISVDSSLNSNSDAPGGTPCYCPAANTYPTAWCTSCGNADPGEQCSTDSCDCLVVSGGWGQTLSFECASIANPGLLVKYVIW